MNWFFDDLQGQDNASDSTLGLCGILTENTTRVWYSSDISSKVCRIVNNITTSEFVLEKGNLKGGFNFVELKGPDQYRKK